MGTMFGETIENVLSRPGQSKIPSVLKLLYRWLFNNAFNLEGLFRVSAGVRDLDNLKQQFNSGNEVQLDNYDPHLIAGVLKAYFIELPDPLLTFELYDSFIEAADNKDKLKVVFQKLPESRKMTASSLFLFLHHVSRESAINKMTTHNLAIVFGQILLRPKIETLEFLLRHSPKINTILKSLIDNIEEIITFSQLDLGYFESIFLGDGEQEEEEEEVDEVEEPVIVTPEQQKLINIQVTVDSAIDLILQRLECISNDLNASNSLEETIEIAKMIRTAKRVLFANPDEANV